MERTRRAYKERIIDSRVYPLRGGGFTAHFSIEDHRGAEILETLFFTGQRFADEQTARSAALQLAVRQIERGYDPDYNAFC